MSETFGSAPSPQDDVNTTIAKYYGAENVPDLYGLEPLRLKAASKSTDLLANAQINVTQEAKEQVISAEQREAEAIKAAQGRMENIFELLQAEGKGNEADYLHEVTTYEYRDNTEDVMVTINDGVNLNGLHATTGGEPFVLPDNLHVKGFLSLKEANIAALPHELHVGGSLDISKTHIKVIHEGTYLEGSLDISGSDLTSLPQGIIIPRDLIMRDTKLRTIQKDTIIEGKLTISGKSNLKLIFASVEVKGRIDLISLTPLFNNPVEKVVAKYHKAHGKLIAKEQYRQEQKRKNQP